MKNRVTHFIRKSTHLHASFIQNQISNHINFIPSIVYKNISKINDGGFAEFRNSEISILNLNKTATVSSKLKYKFRKLITVNDIRKIDEFTDNSDIFHFHYGTDAGIYLPLLKNIHKPKVVSFYGYDCSGFPKRFFGLGRRYLNKRTFKYADYIFAMSPDMKKDLINVGCPREKIIVHYYGSDTKQFYEDHPYNRNSKEVSFLIVSGLVPQKGHLFILKSFKEAFKENKNIKLKIVGSGELEPEIAGYIKENSMGSYVSLEGKTVYASNQHKMYFNNSDVFIHPSVTDVNGDKEGIPGAIVEAMAAGLPVISTYHAGIPYIIKDGVTGLLVEEWDVDNLVKSILDLTENLDKRKKIGLAGQKYAFKNLELLEKEKELENLYRKIISEY